MKSSFYRILQEFLSNSVKYSKAKNLKIVLQYRPHRLYIIAEDDDKGFNMNEVEKGSGLINMESRVILVHAELTLSSKPNKGVKMEIDYPYALS